jgi:hypothetical protein
MTDRKPATSGRVKADICGVAHGDLREPPEKLTLRFWTLQVQFSRRVPMKNAAALVKTPTTSPSMPPG